MTSADSPAAQTISPWLREILRCPVCKGELTDGANDRNPTLDCAACPASYDVIDGMPILLPPQTSGEN